MVARRHRPQPGPRASPASPRASRRESQRAVLDELGCENAQGYLFARPGRATDMAEVLRRLERDPAPTAVAAPVSVPAPAPVPAPTKV